VVTWSHSRPPQSAAELQPQALPASPTVTQIGASPPHWPLFWHWQIESTQLWPEGQSAAAAQPPQNPLVQPGESKGQSVAVRHWTHDLALVSQNRKEVPVPQSASFRHSTQVLELGSQTWPETQVCWPQVEPPASGMPPAGIPPQYPCTQLPVPAGQSRSLPQRTQLVKADWVQKGTQELPSHPVPVGQSELKLHVPQVELIESQPWPAAQSAAERHCTQVPMQNGVLEPADWQSESLRHASQPLGVQYGEDAAQSPLVRQGTQIPALGPADSQ
jgi:hypothetical protein